MLKNIFVKEKKYLHIAFVNTPALCNLASDLAHNVFIILYYEQCRVKRCCKCTFFRKKRKKQIFNWTLEEASVCMNCLDVFFIVLTLCKLAFL